MDKDDYVPPKKSVTRKKLVDLKAVAALLDENENSGDETPETLKKDRFESAGAYAPNEDIIQETARIKSQRDLINNRIRKMEINRNKVSKNVFEKVHRDYRMQLGSINQLFEDKKQILDKELKNLYMLREKQSMEIGRHKEILEEAQFRHYLEEFTEEQFREVAEYESREIHKLEQDLARIQSYIKMHEELFDPEDLGALAQPVAAPRVKIPPPPAEKPPAKPEEEAEDYITDTQETTDHGYFEQEAPEEKVAVVKKEEDEGDREEAVETAPPVEEITEARAPVETASIQAKSPQKKEETGKTLIKKQQPEEIPSAAEPESIYDVLEDLPLECEKEEGIEPSVSLSGNTPDTAGVAGSHKLIFTQTETDLDFKEYLLKDNISIGRSPSNDLVLKAPKVSRQHAAINKYRDQYILIDLKSSNGVFVNGKKVDEQTLQDGDEITVGGFKMKFTKV